MEPREVMANALVFPFPPPLSSTYTPKSAGILRTPYSTFFTVRPVSRPSTCREEGRQARQAGRQPPRHQRIGSQGCLWPRQRRRRTCSCGARAPRRLPRHQPRRAAIRLSTTGRCGGAAKGPLHSPHASRLPSHAGRAAVSSVGFASAGHRRLNRLQAPVLARPAHDGGQAMPPSARVALRVYGVGTPYGVGITQ